MQGTLMMSWHCQTCLSQPLAHNLHSFLLLAPFTALIGQRFVSVYLTRAVSYLAIVGYNGVSKIQEQRMLRALCCAPLSPGPLSTLGLFPPRQREPT